MVNESMALLTATGKIPDDALHHYQAMASTGNARGVVAEVGVEVHRQRVAMATVSAVETEIENLEAVPDTKDPTTTEMIGRRNEIGLVVDGIRFPVARVNCTSEATAGILLLITHSSFQIICLLFTLVVDRGTHTLLSPDVLSAL
jgi:hypothetical protein